MRQGITFWICLIFCLSNSFVHSVAPRNISFTNQQSYGKKTKWNELFTHDRGYSICSDQRGYVFVADQKENRILCFNEKGEYLFRFGQKGQGPGDLEHPISISCFLDSQLVISEFPLIRTLSLHTRQGEFLKKIRLQHAPRRAWLTGSHSLLYTTQGLIGPQDKSQYVFKLILLASLDSPGGSVVKETMKDVSESFYDPKTKISWPNGISPNLFGEQSVSVNTSGQVLVGSTDENRVTLYLAGLGSSRTLSLPLTRSPHVKDYVEKSKKRILQENDTRMLEFLKDKRLVKIFLASNIDLEYLPYYRCIYLSDDSKIIVFLFEAVEAEKKQTVLIFSSTGDLLDHLILDLSPFSISPGHIKFPNLFTVSGSSLWALLPAINDEGDHEFRLYCAHLNI